MLENALPGTVTWSLDSLTVLMTDTSTVAVGDWIKRVLGSGLLWKITAKSAGDVTIENPDSLPIAEGSGGYKTDEIMAREILEAGDVVRSEECEAVDQSDDAGTIPVAINGTFDFKGDGTASGSDLAQLSVGDFVHLTSDKTKLYKIASISAPTVNLTDVNGIGWVTGTGGTKCNVRPTKIKYASATIHAGKTHETVPEYTNVGTNVKDYMKMTGVQETVV